MNNFILFYFLPTVTAFALSFLFTKLVHRLAIRWQIVDRPGERKVHERPIPLLGGWGIFLSLLVSVILFIDLANFGSLQIKNIVGFLLAAFILMIGGFLDDKYNLRPRWQILFPLLACLVVISSGIGIKFISNPWGGLIHLDQWKILLFWWQGVPYYFSVWSDIFSFIWLISMTYVTKLLDGLDGLATGIGLIGSVIIFVVSIFWDISYSVTSLLSLISAGALAGFLLWNFYPAKIFLGEGGSTLIGFVLGVLSIISGGKIATALLVMGLPILDVVWIIIRRLFWEKHSFAQADDKHLHHRLLRIGLSQRQVVFLFYTLTTIFGISSIFFETKGKILIISTELVIMILLALYLINRDKKHAV
ncbi:MAG: hypothetical protein COX77_01175 [Candidatus Komeilibacteria bacterium CG_4_10_14_0_2_um_filter_37_10]|uniref:Undecaprenyl-phosphate alpha-N-acetylglucosaminyl 1-phosphate transferase n=1 Tax=Candidatus Komeilibacteria bacterium CG_4_10_14_0_2_um_filter_37_10 TaxID=1974470 RepID=A0A2M7VFY6_9BACT|nr:MAG: hypothetical protein COX77_01175 [Candidatus Komeilibacteria bacterium CG_4_10_14_0_2_um_filter_37_10]